tara:strand:- start:688 stop:846 length:159 start_codon:yes stop_codon:yes gene_type:complete
MSKEKIESVIESIEIDINTIKEEGFITPENWYALDRIQNIKESCEKLLAELG